MRESTQHPVPVPPDSAAVVVPSSTRGATGPCPSLHDADAEDPAPDPDPVLVLVPVAALQ